MFKIINDNTIFTNMDIRKKYPGCKFVMVDIDNSDDLITTGRLHCISTDSQSYKDLLNECRKIELSGKPYYISGMYEDDFAFGLQVPIR